MIKYLTIFIIIIGIIKCLSMLVVLILSLSNIWRTKKIIEVKRDCSFYVYEDDWCCIIPTIAFTHTDKFFEFKVQWLKFVYYAAYSLELEDND